LADIGEYSINKGESSDIVSPVDVDMGRMPFDYVNALTTVSSVRVGLVGRWLLVVMALVRDRKEKWFMSINASTLDVIGNTPVVTVAVDSGLKYLAGDLYETAA
jgi:hypothetical protein